MMLHRYVPRDIPAELPKFFLVQLFLMSLNSASRNFIQFCCDFFRSVAWGEGSLDLNSWYALLSSLSRKVW